MKFWPRKKHAPRKRGRLGLVEMNWKGGGLIGRGSTGIAQVVVEERGRLNGLSRVRFVRASGIPRHYTSDIRDLMPEWIDTHKITWLDNPRNMTEPGGSNLGETNAAGLRGGEV